MTVADTVNKFDVDAIITFIVNFVKAFFIVPMRYYDSLSPTTQLVLTTGSKLLLIALTVYIFIFIIRNRNAWLYVKY